MGTFYKSELRISGKIRFVTDMISSVDSESGLDLEGITTSPIVDQILAYGMDFCQPISERMHSILTVIRSTSIFTRILRCRALGVSVISLSGFLSMSLLSRCGAIVGVVIGLTPSIDSRSLRSCSGQ